MKDFREQNFYELLEIPSHATREEIEQAYRRALGIFSEDSVAVYALFSPEELTALRRRLDEAYQTLSDPQRRRNYDLDLGLRRPDSTPPPLSPSPSSSPSTRAEDTGMAATPATVVPAPTPSSAGEVASAPESAKTPTEAPPLPVVGPDTKVDGTLLRQLREARGLTLEKLSELTKINIYYLRQMEENRFDLLPEPVYVRGYLRLLAGTFKVNAQYLVEGYSKNLKNKG